MNVSRPGGPRRPELACLAAPLLAVFLAITGCQSTPSENGDDDAQVNSPTPTPEDPGSSPSVSSPTPAGEATPTEVTPSETPEPPPSTPALDPYATCVDGDCPTAELEASVEVRFDSLGIPHIYADSDADLFFTQGYLIGRDRLFQLDLTRRQALGTLSEIYGAGKLDDDVIVRSFRPLQHASEELERWTTDRPRELAWAQAYCAGVNAYIDDAVAGRNGAALPAEFDALGYVPQYLDVTQVLAMDYLLAVTLGPDPMLELTVTLIGLLVGQDALQDLLRTQPIELAFTVPDAETAVDAGGSEATRSSARRAAGASRSTVVGRTLEAAQRRSKHRTGHIDPAFARRLGPELTQHLEAILSDPAQVQQLRDALARIQDIDVWKRFEGSNAWVVHGDHTVSGAPLLANDTHMGIAMPNTYSEVHLNTADAGQDIDAIGIAIGGGPGVLFGHTRKAGWGVTISFFDLTDLYLEKPNAAGTGVQFNGEVVPYDVWDERFIVRQDDGSFSQEVETLKRVPQHGPILPNELLGLPDGLVISMHWVGDQPGTTLGTIYKFMQAENMDDLEAAMADHRIGAGNWVFATTDGDIAYDARVRLPIRANPESAAPPWEAMPGTGDYEWTGEYIPADDVPHVVNPAAGFAVTANNDPSGNTADNDPLNDDEYFGALYDTGMRAWRIDTWLRTRFEAGQRVDVADIQTLQADVLSVMGQRLVPYLLEAASRRPDLVTAELDQALSYLEGWDFRMAADSQAACIYADWWTIAIQEIFQDELDPSLFDSMNGDTGGYFARPLVHFLDVTADDIDQIDAGTTPFPSATGVNYFDDQSTADVVETRDQQLLEALQRAVSHLSSTFTGLGVTDMSQWRWDLIHTVTFNNESDRWIEEDLDRGPFPLDGDAFTVDVAEGNIYSSGNPPSTYRVTKAPTLRMVMDFADGKIEAVNAIPGGQSGNGLDTHYDDQIAPWLENIAMPLAFERADVEADTEMLWTMPDGFPANELIVN